MLPRTTSIWQRDSQPNASGRPGAVHIEERRLSWRLLSSSPSGPAALNFLIQFRTISNATSPIRVASVRLAPP